MVKYIKCLFIVVASLALLSGCKSDNSFNGDSSGSSSSTGSSSTSTTGTTTTQVISLGSGSGSSFSAGTLAIGVSPLSAGGSTSITANLVDQNGSLYTTDVDVTFSSQCAGLGTATLTSPVTTTNGTAISTYVAKGCSGNDTITASATVDNTVLTATATINVLAPTLGSIQFVSATPETIALKGTGGAGLSSTSTVVFQVFDTTGGPAANQDIDFALNTTVGGLALSPATGKTDVSGKVQTVVEGGTVHTPVRVTATIAGTTPTISTQSDQLTVTTGIPDQDSFSLSASKFNPEAWSYDGETVDITARLADRFNNPVPDGTAVTFTAEGGAIVGSCTTTDGGCTVTWTSQNPRPCGQVIGDPTLQADPVLNSCVTGSGTNANVPQTGTAPLGQPYGGRVTILATAVGEESFVDVNGNGVFDDGDTFEDLPEAYRDDNENNSRDSNEPFVDFNENAAYDAADGLFNGILCEDSTRCSSTKTINVRQSLLLVMSGSAAAIDISPASVNIANGGSTTVTVTVSDMHNQPLPEGTTVDISTTQGSIEGGSAGSSSIASTNANTATQYQVTLKGSKPTDPSSGTLTVKVTSPKGIVTIASIPVTEGGAPGADLALAMSDAPDPVTNGNNVTYTLTITNNGPDTATGVTLADTLPSSGATFVSATPSQGNCYGTGPVNCSLGDIANGANATVSVVLQTTATGVISNSATVSTTVTDPNSGNDTTGENTTVN